jgi:heme-degrading monooxygenase HmoA
MSNARPTIMLVVRNLKSDLPWPELERRYKERMPQFREVPGLVQKYYSRNPQTGEVAGIYFWESEEALQAYLESDLRKTIPTAYELTEAPVIERFDLVDVLRD